MRRWTSYSPQKQQGQTPADKTSPDEKKLLAILKTPHQFDQLAGMKELGLATSQLASLLTILEIKGLIRQLPGKYYQAIVKNIS